LVSMRHDIFVERISVVLAALWLHRNLPVAPARFAGKDLTSDCELGRLPASFALRDLKCTQARLFAAEADNKVNR